jgi:hypothetical protein
MKDVGNVDSTHNSKIEEINRKKRYDVRNEKSLLEKRIHE